MRTIVIFGGRFHPPHLGHKSVYDKLSQEFGADNTYIVSSNKQAPMSSPFTFEQKKKLWTFMGVPDDHVVQVKNPYMPKEITDHLDTANTAIVFAISAKDSKRFTFKPKKDGSPSYMQPYEKDKHPEPIDNCGYILIAPTMNFEINGEPVTSASEIRGMYIKANDANRVNILKGLYGKATKQIKSVFDKQLSMTETFLKLWSSTQILTEDKVSLRNKAIISKALILERRISEEEFKHPE